jgi:hypothetical protein
MAENNPSDVSKILSTIREVESGNNYSVGSKSSSASGAYQFIDSTWRDSTKKFGIGTEYQRAKDAPPEIQDAVAAAAVKDILQRVGGDVSKVPIVWYTGNPQGQMTEAALKANQGLTPDRYQQKWLSVFNKGAPTTVQAKPTQVAQAAAPAASVMPAAQAKTATDLPPSYRMALAANYLADTESPETSVVERAMEMLTESQGGASKNPMTAFTQATGEQTIDPFQFVNQPQEEPKRRALPRMPVRMAEGGPVTNENESQIERLYRENLGRQSDVEGRQFWEKEFGPEVDAAERLRFIEGAAPEVQRRMAAGDKTLPGFMQVPTDVRAALQSTDLTTDQYKTLANYFGNQWIGGEAEDPASLTRRDYIERPRSGYDFATFLASRSKNHGAAADTQQRFTNLMAPYVGMDTGSPAEMFYTGGESNDYGYIVTNPLTGERQIAYRSGPLGPTEEGIYRTSIGKHHSTIGDPDRTRYAAGMDYRVDPQTGRVTFVSPYLEGYQERKRNNAFPIAALATIGGMALFPGADLVSMASRGAINAAANRGGKLFSKGGEAKSDDKELSEERGGEADAEQMTVGTLPMKDKYPLTFQERLERARELARYNAGYGMTGIAGPLGPLIGNLAAPYIKRMLPPLSSGYSDPELEPVKRSNGSPSSGEVADIAEQMTVGTIPTEGQTPAGQAFRNIGRDVVRGAQYLPYDLIGAPVDIATMAMRPFGYNVEKPFMGSEYLIDKARQAGIADQPTGSAAETATRIGMGFVNPAAVARQIPKGIAALERGAETLGTGAVRAITGKPEITTEQIYQAMGEPQGILQLGATAATRPLGSTISTGEPVRNFSAALKSQFDELLAADPEMTAMSGREGFRAANDKYGQVVEAASTSFVPKLQNFINRQYGTVNDPLYEATVTGKFTPKAFYAPNKVFSWDKNVVASVTGIPLKNEKLSMDHVSSLQRLAAGGNEDARRLLGAAYDLGGMTKGIFSPQVIVNSLKDPTMFKSTDEYLKGSFLLKDELKNSLPEDQIRAYIAQKGVPNPKDKTQETIFSHIGNWVAGEKRYLDLKRIRAEMPEGKTMTATVFSDVGNERNFDLADLTPAIREQMARGEPVYQIPTNLYSGVIDYEDIARYMFKNPPEKWSKMSVPELVMASHTNPGKVTDPKKVARMADDGVELMPFQRILGTESYMPVKSQMLGDGAEWREIKTKEGLRIEGGMMDHCLKKDAYGYCNRLMNKESKYFTLRDADGQPYVTIEMTKPIGQEKENVPFSVVKQIKGFYNKTAVPAYGEEISDFLSNWQSKIGTQLRVSEASSHVPNKFKPKQFGMESPEEFAKGGMVDKPLYDRAA